jgi:predicted transcriptional regulator
MASELISYISKRRDRLIIISEILAIAKNGTSKTNIMFKVNLSFTQLNQYISLLLKASLLDKSNIDGKDVYVVTKRGLDFLEKQCEVLDLLNGVGGSNCFAKVAPSIFRFSPNGTGLF